ncbi:hypothetical protein F5X98DRAFT_49690 [Xylaria grammica]|nr:hypothetical protein F5X98DRAFT_49690 [Xylaria grammica]
MHLSIVLRIWTMCWKVTAFTGYPALQLNLWWTSLLVPFNLFPAVFQLLCPLAWNLDYYTQTCNQMKAKWPLSEFKSTRTQVVVARINATLRDDEGDDGKGWRRGMECLYSCEFCL